MPNGATILSATLALYKQYYNDTLRLNALLKPWVESQATWTVSQTGVPWTVGGAAGAGTDYSTATDALVTAQLESRLGQLRRDPARAAVGEQRRELRLAHGADDQRQQLETVQLERVHHRHHAATQADDRLFRRQLERPADGQHHEPGTKCGDHARSELHVSANASDSDGTVTKVDFFANGLPIGTDTTAPYSITWTPAATGSYSLTARATDNLGAVTTSSNSATVSVTSATTTAVTSSVNPSTFGVSVTFTASITGNAPTGTVGFTNNGSAIAGCTAQAVSAGKATCATSALTAGSHSIVATYGGDINNNGSTSATLTQTVNKATSKHDARELAQSVDVRCERHVHGIRHRQRADRHGRVHQQRQRHRRLHGAGRQRRQGDVRHVCAHRGQPQHRRDL